MTLGGVGEWFIGNTFPCVVFTSFGSTVHISHGMMDNADADLGAFWLTFGGTLQPSFGAYGAYSTDLTNPAAGLKTVGFNASFGK